MVGFFNDIWWFLLFHHHGRHGSMLHILQMHRSSQAPNSSNSFNLTRRQEVIGWTPMSLLQQPSGAGAAQGWEGWISRDTDMEDLSHLESKDVLTCKIFRTWICSESVQFGWMTTMHFLFSVHSVVADGRFLIKPVLVQPVAATEMIQGSTLRCFLVWPSW